ncbi:MAG: PEGA domain-containing protein [Bacteroidales bacterium]|nr:PEGA domain-containing protein [Bacteroidales bacterium]MBO7528450.1 PEGA domain-containing protein [Bacteroidales bacterium]
MKKSFLLIILIISSFLCQAQLQVKDGSFKKVDGFVNINIEKMFDDNDRPYAVLKIKTENINDKQRRELSFGGDAQTFFETEYKDGEVWLYISYYATFLKISHPDLSSTEFWFPFDMEPKRGYELTLVNKPSIDEEIISRIEKLENSKAEVVGNPEDFGYIVVKTGSLEGATVYIDGNEMEMKTPFVSDPIKKGPHKIKVVKDGYEVYSDIVAVEGNGMKTVNVDLKKCKSINIYRNDKGYVFIPEFGFGGIDVLVDANPTCQPRLNIEYMFKPSFGLGIGAECVYTFDKHTSLSLLGQFSYYFTNRKTSPYINIKIGYSIGLSNATYYDHYCSLEGPMGMATIGVNIKQHRIGAVIGGYHFKHSYDYDSHSYTSYHEFVGITYSYLIPFGKK